MAAVLGGFDAIPLGASMAIVNELRGRVHQGHALAGIHRRFARHQGTISPPMY
ncbi:hypothetical protein [Mesorhizobium sp. M0488]|uniref:hypothetical protein n=1 Tax=unclassified Mesorhizobium TaxID=325217 RepID=UPI0033396031